MFWRIHDGAPKEGLAKGDPVRIVDFRKAWTTACKAAGCPALLVHDFRRTAARTLTLAGVDRQQARLFTGHRTEAMFVRYNIDDDRQLREAAERYTAYVTAERAKAARSGRARRVDTGGEPISARILKRARGESNTRPAGSKPVARRNPETPTATVTAQALDFP